MGRRRQCPQCRFDVEAEDPACPFCGVVQETVQPPSTASKGRPALKPCPDCGATVSARAESCPKCGCPIQGKLRPSKWTVGKLAKAQTWGFALLVFLSIVTAGRRGAKAPPNSPRVAPGERAVLACKGGDGANVAFGVEAWSRMAHPQARRDAAEMGRLVEAGRIALVTAGTPVRVVTSGTMMLRILLLASPHEGRGAGSGRNSSAPHPSDPAEEDSRCPGAGPKPPAVHRRVGRARLLRFDEHGPGAPPGDPGRAPSSSRVDRGPSLVLVGLPPRVASG
jgi:ribosomal protein L40E